MTLKEIYLKDINRQINPAVVVSNKSKETVRAEIQEYIFTDELIEKLYKLLDTVLNKREGKTGIWINGYYGSGKSHFIKYAHYCLDDQHSEEAFDYFLKAVNNYGNTKVGANYDITPSNVALLRKKISNTHFDNIMFNVEDETGDGDAEERMTRIFLNVFNQFRGYNANDIPLATLLEKKLDAEGVFEQFKALIAKELDNDWTLNAAQIASFQLNDVLDIAKRLMPKMDTVSMHAKLSNPEAYKVGIKATLIPELQEYLKTKDKGYRLLFLVDEVSQYIGTNSEILLNFQNIIERISDDCNNQVWIACTAQQTIDDVTSGANDGDVDKAKDGFGKILGRFDTRISLQSNDASFITQHRVLEKNSQGEEKLGKLFHKNKDYILNQFKINHELYKGYKSEDDFCLAYPFIPYQFKLIAHVFEAFQQLGFVIKEVKDNERSVLGATHFTAIQNKEKEVGVFMPFDAFYGEQFHTNLTHRGYRAIENAFELSFVKDNEFAQRVVKNLFMISNLLETQRQTFPSTIDNLTVLMMTQLDQNKMELQKEIKTILDKLMDESIIREEKGSFFFFNEDEINVQNLIKEQPLGFDEKLEYFDKLLFRPIIKISSKVTFGENDFKMGYAVEEKEFLRQGDFNMIILLTDRTPIASKALSTNNMDVVVCLNEWFLKDESLRKDFDWYCKTLNFFTNQGDGVTGERAKTIDSFKVRNASLKDSLTFRLEQKFSETRFISQQRIVEADRVSGSSPKERIANLIEKHLGNIYKSHKMASSYAQNERDLKTSAANKQTLVSVLTPAEQTVNDLITTYNNRISVQELIREFDKDPFGWRYQAVLDILVQLVKKKQREFVYRNTPRFPIVDFINKAIVTSERIVCEVRSGEEIDQAILSEVGYSYKEVFNKDLAKSTDSNELETILRDALEIELQKYKPYESDYYGTYPYGDSFHQVVKTLTEWKSIRNPKTLFQTLIADKATSKSTVDTAKGMVEFVNKNRQNYERIQKFYEENKSNFLELSIAEKEKVERIEALLQATDPRRAFRVAIKAYEELKKALKEKVKLLKKEVGKTYQTIFTELEASAAKNGVTTANVYADKEHTLQSIKSLKSIAQLQNKQLNASNFKSEQLIAVIKYAADNSAATPSGVTVNEPEIYYITGVKATISNEKELNDYLAKVKAAMQQLLKENKTIILK